MTGSAKQSSFVTKEKNGIASSLRSWEETEESFTSPYRLDPPHFHPSGSAQGRYPTRNDKEKIEEANHVPIRKAHRSGFSPRRRAEGVGLPCRGLRTTCARRRPGPAAHHLAVARSLYARAH